MPQKRKRVIKTTVEEIEILITTKVEDNLKQNMPKIKQMVETIRQQFEKVDMSGFQKKTQQAVEQAGKSMKNIKNTGTDKALESQFEKAGQSVEKYQNQLEQTKQKLREVYAQMDNKVEKTWSDVMPDGLSRNNPQVEKAVAPVVDSTLARDSGYQKLITQEGQLNTKIEELNSKLQEAKQNYANISAQIQQSQSKQNIFTKLIDKANTALKAMKGQANGVKGAFSKLPSLTTKVNTKIKQMSGGMKTGLKHVLKYAGALFSLRGIYSVLSNSANAWLSSQNSQAKQLSANIEYMKYAMGSAFAPVIQYVTNLVYQLMKAIQSVVYALFKVNIFANTSAKSYSSMADSASKASKETKSLAGFDEINNIGGSDSDSSGESGTTAPNIDLSTIDTEAGSLSQKLTDFFAPLIESWNTYGKPVVESCKNAINGILASVSAMWTSVETIITNGTIYSIIANILNSIGQIGQDWANAWNNDNNGTEIIQGIANMINDLTSAILKLVTSTGFQTFLNGIISAFSGIVQFLEPVISGFVEMSGVLLEIAMSTIGNLLESIGNALQSIAQNETAVEILKAVGSAIAIIVGAIVAWNVAQIALNAVITIFNALMSPITLVILGIVAAITAVILVIKNWGSISEWFNNLWSKIKETLINVWNTIKEKATSIFNTVKTKITTIFTNIKDKVASIVTTFKTKVTSIFTGIKDKITSVVSTIYTKVKDKFTSIKDKATSIFNSMKTTIKSIFDGIWTNIKKVINSILGGIEGMANGVVKGINKVIQAMNRIKFTIPDWVPGGMGGKSFGFNISELQQVNIPKLATGNVATEETLAIFGEYSNAKSNPEITAPQSIIYDTMKQALDDSALSGNKGNGSMPKEIVIKFGSLRVAYEIEELIRKAQRQSGTATVTI